MMAGLYHDADGGEENINNDAKEKEGEEERGRERERSRCK